jgi:hypothetical protein
MDQPKLTDRVNNDTQSIEELWESLAKLSQNITKDNQRYNGEYPISIRERQMITLDSLVNAIKGFHINYNINKHKNSYI